MRLLTATLGCVLAMLATAASAQTMLQPGVAVRGALGPNSPRYSSGVRYDCYMLQTTPGSRWVIEMQGQFDTLLWLAVGEDCATVSEGNWLRSDDDGGGFLQTNARMVFNAGGGTYLVVARGYDGVNAAGTYTLTARREPGEHRRGMMRPGLDIIRLEPAPGTASTVSGPPPGRTAGEVFRDCDICPSMVVVDAGSFMMGSPAGEAGRAASEGPRHVVTLNRAFAVGQFEVTFDEYDACVAERACAAVQDAGWGRGRRPAMNVTFFDALRYVDWLSKRTGQRYFLPSEAEWEYVARAGSDTSWNTGSTIITDDANIQNQFARTVPVGAYPPNALGLYDTHGNVSEWTLDCSDTGYVGAPTDGSAVRSGNCAQGTAVRGGMYAQEASLVRSASRAFGARNTRYTGVGFRVTRALEGAGGPAQGPEGQYRAALERMIAMSAGGTCPADLMGAELLAACTAQQPQLGEGLRALGQITSVQYIGAEGEGPERLETYLVAFSGGQTVIWSIGGLVDDRFSRAFTGGGG